MRFVLAKSAEQQAQGMALKVRETLVGQRTQLVNALRGHAAEFGLIAAKGITRVASLLTAIEAEITLPTEAKEMLALLGREIEHLDTRLKEIEARLRAMHRANAISQLLATIPGIGPIIALTLALEVDPTAFESGRHLAAWLGLTPKEHSTGGKQRLGGISRAGHERLRALLVTGATAVIQVATRPGNKLATDWLLKLLQRRPRKLAAVALANKMARIAWAKLAKVPTDQLRSVGMPDEGMMTSGEAYRHPAGAAGTGARIAVVS
jgi:transposase